MVASEICRAGGGFARIQECLSAARPPRAAAALRLGHFMLLAQSGKCRGFRGRAPENNHPYDQAVKAAPYAGRTP